MALISKSRNVTFLFNAQNFSEKSPNYRGSETLPKKDYIFIYK